MSWTASRSHDTADADSCRVPLSVTELIDQVLGLRERLRTSETTLLVVDDDAGVLDAIRTVLEVKGFTVHVREDPTRLWEELERCSPDLLMLDIEMPGISGLELCRAVRNDPRWSALPVLILTARRDPGTVQAVFAAGADDYVAKPFAGQRAERPYRQPHRARAPV